MLRTTALALTLAACALLPAAGASAATLTVDDASTIHYVADAGEENRLSMTVLDVGYAVIKDDAVPGLTACGTIWTHPGWRSCPNARRPQVVLGDGDDQVAIADGGSEPMEWIGAARVDAGSGDDNVRTGASADVLLGGDGNDTLRGFEGANRIEGGPGDDTLDSVYNGDDTKIGGPGADTFLGADGNETIDAVDGAATDTVTCGFGTDTVRADAGDTVATDCETVTRVALPGGKGSDPIPTSGEGTDPSTREGSDPSTHGDAPVRPAIGPPPPPPAADRTAPKLKVKVRRKRGRRVVTVRSDEAATLTIGRRTKRLTANKPVRLVLRGRKAVRLVARDAAGNQTVKRLR